MPLPPIAAIPPALVAPAVPGTPVTDAGVTGDVRLVSDFPSATLHNTRDVCIFLPPGYEDPRNQGKRYPVLYLQDGQNLFDPQTAFMGNEWHLDETAQALMQDHKMQDVILVGVYNTPQRMSEYTPVPDPQDGGGNAVQYTDFLIHELKPWVDAHLRTRPDAADTGIMGSSLGGLESLYAGWKHPDVFGIVGAVSPSCWWDNEWLAQAETASPPAERQQRIWLDIGTNEGDDPQAMLADTEHMHQVLLNEGYQDDNNLFYRVIPGAQHNESAWAARSGDILTHLFPTDTPP